MAHEPPTALPRLAPGEVARSSDLVDYAAGAIASRALVKTATTDVSIMAFDAGQRLQAHTVAVDALVQVLEGEVEITIAGQPHRLHGGDLILMPALQPHALLAVTRFKMILTRMRP